MRSSASSSAGRSAPSRRSRTGVSKCSSASSSRGPRLAMPRRAWQRAAASFLSRYVSRPLTADARTGGWPPRTSRSTVGSGSRGSTTLTFTTAGAGRARPCSAAPMSTTSRSPTGSDSSHGDGQMVNQLRDAGIGFRYTAEQAARFRQKGWWGDEILLDHLDRWTADAPERELATDGVGRLTYGQARGEAYRLVPELRRMGVDRGDRVLAQLPNWNEFVVIYLAALRAGAVLVPIMPIYRHDEVGYIRQRSEAKVAFTAGVFRNFDHLQMFRELRPASQALERIVVVRGAPSSDELALADLTQPDRGAEDFDESAAGQRPGADDGHVLIFTSGTESRPKGCFHT